VTVVSQVRLTVYKCKHKIDFPFSGKICNPWQHPAWPRRPLHTLKHNEIEVLKGEYEAMSCGISAEIPENFYRAVAVPAISRIRLKEVEMVRITSLAVESATTRDSRAAIGLR
jgi:hypothetical protein